MKSNLFLKLGVLLLLLPLYAKIQARGGKANSLNKTLGTPSITRFNINRIGTYIYGNGRADFFGSNPGYFYPILSGKTANFQSGFLWGGYVGNQLRVGGSVYRTSLTPGRIMPDGSPENPSANNVRIYRVRSDYKTGSFLQEEQDEGRSATDIYNQYEKDWYEWPADEGAPYLDVNGDGKYDPSVDIPGVPGADQTIWYVANDLNTNAATAFYGTVPMGIELQCTVWGYAHAGILGQMLFKSYIMINKSPVKINFNQFYVSYWSDTDIGDGAHDFSGCDTTLSLFYTFSGIANNVQYGTNPPATGFDFMQGPRIRSGDPKDTAIFKGKYWSGYKNLPMTSDYFFINSDATYGDPDQNSSVGTTQWYNLFQAKVASTGQPFTDPTTGKPSRYPLYGDPITKTGGIDGILRPPGDRRNGGVSGPFTLAYGDTQEVVIAQMSAGVQPGFDNLGAVRELKKIDNIAQMAYNRLFQIPSDVSETKSKLPAQFSLSQNYPNPFNPVTIIKYAVPKTSFVNITVYDLLGREIVKLINEEKPPGNYDVKFDGSNLASGIYFYRLNAGDFTQTKKLILLK